MPPESLDAATSAESSVEASPAACLMKLAPFLVGRSRRGVVGSSRYAQALRGSIRAAAADPQAGPQNPKTPKPLEDSEDLISR